MSEQFTETVTTSWPERLKNSIKGIFVGLLLFLVSFPLIFWNEGRFIDRLKVLEEGLNSVTHVESSQILQDYQGALVHISGVASTSDVLKDTTFGIEANAIKLNRKVESYQWRETSTTKTKKDYSGAETKETTYTYEKVWSDYWIDSNKFKKKEGHENPKPPFNSMMYVANNVTVGAFRITDSFIQKIHKTESINLNNEIFSKMDPSIKDIFIIHNNTLFKGTPETPEIGNVRISFNITPLTEVSAIGKQHDDSLQVFHSKNGSIGLLTHGYIDAATMFQNEKDNNQFLAWLLRILSLLLMWLGLNFMIAPFAVILDKLPFLGDILNSGVKIFTFMISVALSFTTIAISWLFFKPMLALGLLVIISTITFLVFKISRMK